MEHDPMIEKKSRRLDPTVRNELIALGTIAGLLAGISYGTHHQPKTETRLDEQSTPQPTQESDDIIDLTDIEVLKVQTMNPDPELSKYSDERVNFEFRYANYALHDMTDRTFSVEDTVVIHPVRLIPDTLFTDEEGGESVSCYSDKQLNNARRDYLENTKQAPNTRTATLIDQGVSCRNVEYGDVAWAGEDWTVYDTVFDNRVILHEEGHIEGLSHSAAVECEDGTMGNSLRARSETDVSILIGQWCDAVTKYDEHKGATVTNPYSNSHSVMGGIDPDEALRYRDLYDIVSLNKIAPEDVRNLDVDPIAGDYIVGPGRLDTRLLTFNLDDGHPLKLIDPKIDKLSIGVQRMNIDQGTTTITRIMAHHDGMSYDLNYGYKFRHDLEEKLSPNGEEVLLYVDKTLGVRIYASLGEDILTTNIRVEPFSDSTSIPE